MCGSNDTIVLTDEDDSAVQVSCLYCGAIHRYECDDWVSLEDRSWMFKRQINESRDSWFFMVIHPKPEPKPEG
jgi:RNase P subunit RPR2